MPCYSFYSEKAQETLDNLKDLVEIAEAEDKPVLQDKLDYLLNPEEGFNLLWCYLSGYDIGISRNLNFRFSHYTKEYNYNTTANGCCYHCNALLLAKDTGKHDIYKRRIFQEQSSRQYFVFNIRNGSPSSFGELDLVKPSVKV